MKRLFGIGVVVLLAALVAAAPAFAIPKLMSYQGRLNDKNSNPVNETVPMTFTIWSDETSTGAEKKLWQETQSVVVMGGVFSVKLGEFTPLPESIFDTDVAYLGIKVKDDDEMTPRQQITSAAYSFKSSSSEISDRMLGYLGLANLRNLQLGQTVLGAGNTDGWGEIYIDANGRGDSVVYSGTAASFDTDKYTANKFYLVLEASSLVPSDFAVKIAPGKWVLTSRGATKELQKASVMAGLFNGTTGLAKSASYVGLTAVRTSDSNLIGSTPPSPVGSASPQARRRRSSTT